MKHVSFMTGVLYGLCSMIVIPLILIYINLRLGLPQISGFIPEILGILSILGGGVLLVVSVRAFRKYGKGGSPLPFDPPRRLVTQGIYSHIRNPMFLATALIWVGEFFFFGSILLLPYALIWIVGNHVHLVTQDEKWLEERYGKAYRRYVRDTTRYIPKVV